MCFNLKQSNLPDIIVIFCSLIVMYNNVHFILHVYFITYMYLQLKGINYLLKQIIFGLILLCKYKRYRYKYCEKKM